MAKRKSVAGADLSELLALLRAVYQIHQAAHWQAKGSTFYGDHQLFQRLYEAVVPEIDAVAERTVGLSSDVKLVDPIEQADMTLGYVDDFRGAVSTVKDNKDLTTVSLAAEETLLGFLDDILKMAPSQGTQNLLQGIADTHEGHVYLLRQRLGA